VSHRVLRTLLLTGGTLLAAATSANAGFVGGTVVDRRGGEDNPQQDIVSAVFAYDGATGTVRGAISFAAPPTTFGIGGATISVGSWVKKRGWCAPAADAQLYPPLEDDPSWEAPLYLGNTRGPEAVVSQQGSTVAFSNGWQRIRRKRWNCAAAQTFGPDEDPKDSRNYKSHDETKVFSLTREAVAHPQTPPACGLRTHRVRRGGTVSFRCAHIKGPFAIRFYRRDRLKRTSIASARGGRVSGSARGLRPGTYEAQAWKGSVVIGFGDVTVH
jgi:hypothetical protein